MLTGTRVGGYEILECIGSGGMGEVYRARDEKLRRDVALKVLRTDLSVDKERLLRFRREAQILAALNHPNIAHIFGFEEHENATCIAMELVEGETLAARLQRGPIPVLEALKIGKDIAEALEAAHEKAIIHRDLKPGNIKIAPEGQIKVLDFGLAKAVGLSRADRSDATVETDLTQGGIILGTAPYMSPEQARGAATDQRSDIFSFGCVLYEMLTAKRAFEGETLSEVIASVLAREPDLARLPADLNPKVRDLLKRCLQKDLRKRWQAIGDVRVEIETILEDPSGVKALNGVTHRKTIWKRAVPVVAAALLGALAATTAIWSLWQPVLNNAPLRRFSMQLGDVRPVISPDGAHVAYRSDGRLWVRDLNSETSRQIPGGESTGGYYSAMGYYLTWSPDSHDIVFPAENELRRVSVLKGGSASTICTIPQGRGARMVGGIAWSKDGETIVFSRYGAGIYEVPAHGGSPKLLWEEPHADDLVLLDTPQGRAVLFATLGEGVLGHGLMLRTPTERRKIVQLETSWPELIYSPTGHVLFRKGPDPSPSIWALPFSAETLTAQGEPFLVEPSGQGMSLADDGTLVYLDTGRVRGQHLAWRDRKGKILTEAAEGHGFIEQLSLSPDGNQALITSRDAGRVRAWISDLRRFVETQFALGSEAENNPLLFALWARSGNEIYYALASSTEGVGSYLFAKPLNGLGPARRVPFPKGLAVPLDSTRDGRTLVVTYSPSPTVNLNLWLWRMNGQGTIGEAVDFTHSPENGDGAKFSPNERYLAYTSSVNGRSEVYVRPFQEGSREVRISPAGGSAPIWGPDGTELFFNENNTLMRVPVSTTGEFSAGTPEPLFQHPTLTATAVGNIARYAISTKGEKFLTVETKREFVQPLVRVVENWLRDFRNTDHNSK